MDIILFSDQATSVSSIIFSLEEFVTTYINRVDLYKFLFVLARVL